VKLGDPTAEPEQVADLLQRFSRIGAAVLAEIARRL
jgi:hypothetical protein